MFWGTTDGTDDEEEEKPRDSPQQSMKYDSNLEDDGEKLPVQEEQQVFSIDGKVEIGSMDQSSVYEEENKVQDPETSNDLSMSSISSIYLSIYLSISIYTADARWSRTTRSERRE